MEVTFSSQTLKKLSFAILSFKIVYLEEFQEKGTTPAPQTYGLDVSVAWSTGVAVSPELNT